MITDSQRFLNLPIIKVLVLYESILKMESADIIDWERMYWDTDRDSMYSARFLPRDGYMHARAQLADSYSKIIKVFTAGRPRPLQGDYLSIDDKRNFAFKFKVTESESWSFNQINKELVRNYRDVYEETTKVKAEEIRIRYWSLITLHDLV